jgi:predicted exporter
MSAVTLTQLKLSFDLSAFLPGQSTLVHDILVEQIRNGPSSRLLVIGIDGADRDQLAEASEYLTEELASSPLFISVVNGSFESQADEIPAPVDTHYLLMRNVDYSAESLAAAVQARLRDLAIGGGTMSREVIARDPFLATVDILGGLTPVELSGDLWFSSDGSAIIFAETQAASIDIAAQEAAILLIRQTFESLAQDSSLRIDVTGVGAFSVELQETIRAEATMRSILASAALILVLLLVFRQPGLVLLAALPLAMGFLSGLALVSLLFDTVHGITLAFGFTMLGIAIDYPLHLFSHSRFSSGPKAIASIWPTMLLGALSTIVAYLALVFAGSEGLAQLGLFTTAGVAVALLVTRTWLPFLLRDRSDTATEIDAPGLEPVLSAAPALLLAAIAAALVWIGSDAGLWDDDLGSLSPVPAERLQADQRMRQAAVTPDRGRSACEARTARRVTPYRTAEPRRPPCRESRPSLPRRSRRRRRPQAPCR